MSLVLGRNLQSGTPQFHVSVAADVNLADDPDGDTVFHSDFNPMFALMESFPVTEAYRQLGPYGSWDDMKIWTLEVPISHPVYAALVAGAVAYPLKEGNVMMTNTNGSLTSFNEAVLAPFSPTSSATSLDLKIFKTSDFGNYELTGVVMFSKHRQTGNDVEFRQIKEGALPGIHLTNDTFTVDKYDYTQLQLVASQPITGYQTLITPPGAENRYIRTIPTGTDVTLTSNSSFTSLNHAGSTIFDTRYNFISFNSITLTSGNIAAPYVSNQTKYTNIRNLAAYTDRLVQLTFTHVGNQISTAIFVPTYGVILLNQIGSYWVHDSAFWFWEDDFYANGQCYIEMGGTMLRLRTVHSGDGGWSPGITITGLTVRIYG